MKKKGDIVAYQDEALKTLYAMLAGELPVQHIGPTTLRRLNDSEPGYSRQHFWKFVFDILGSKHGARLERYRFGDINLTNGYESGIRKVEADFWVKFKVSCELIPIEFHLSGMERDGFKKWSVDKIIFHLPKGSYPNHLREYHIV